MISIFTTLLSKHYYFIFIFVVRAPCGSFCLPAYRTRARAKVVLFVKPMEGGQVVLKGVSVEVLSLVTMCKVDKWGRGVALG